METATNTPTRVLHRQLPGPDEAEQLVGPDPELDGEVLDDLQRQVALSALHPTDIGAVPVHDLGQLCLAEPTFVPQPAHLPADLSLQISPHPATITRPLLICRQTHE